ncbi:MAG: hypothetical protein ACKO37_03845 [Vampirovibrionales bacterium]
MKLPTKLPSGLKKSVQKLQTTLKDPLKGPETIFLGFLGGLGLAGLGSTGTLLYRDSQNQQAVKTLVKQDYQKVGMSPPKNVQFEHSSLPELVRYNPEKSYTKIFVDNERVNKRDKPAYRVSQYEKARFESEVFNLTKNDPRGPYISTYKQPSCQLDVAAKIKYWHVLQKLDPSYKKEVPSLKSFFSQYEELYTINRSPDSFYKKCQKEINESAKKGYPLETPEMFVKRVYP